ncbi:hypothetical protein BRARA_E01262 [Brassica rapa]|uniref:Uncharacterized protein n=1 Tax=Brassica campestris TaxID=3711 RepID=A0A397Z934_BRACM|nr:hypothetical protein BRARA_E01262 [Brassica rapa]
MEETTDVVKRKMTPSVPANYVSILQLRERWIKEKERKQRKEQEEAKDEERRCNQHAEEQQTIGDDLKKPQEDLDEMCLNQTNQKHWGRNTKEETAAIGSERGENEGLPEKKKRGRRNRKKKRTNQEVEECGSIKPPAEMHTPVKDQIRVYKKNREKATGKQRAGSREEAVTAIETQLEHLSIKRVQVNKHQSDQKHWGMNSKKDECTEDGEAGWGEEEETAAIRSERGGAEVLPEKMRGRRKRYGRKKKITQECGSIKPPEYTVKESTTPVKDQIRVYRRKEEKAMGNISIEKVVTAIETQFEHLSIKRGQETKHLKAQTRSHDLPLGRVRMPIETATMVWVKKGQEERAVDGSGSCVKTFNA